MGIFWCGWRMLSVLATLCEINPGKYKTDWIFFCKLDAKRLGNIKSHVLWTCSLSGWELFFTFYTITWNVWWQNIKKESIQDSVDWKQRLRIMSQRVRKSDNYTTVGIYPQTTIISITIPCHTAAIKMARQKHKHLESTPSVISYHQHLADNTTILRSGTKQELTTKWMVWKIKHYLSHNTMR